ncbi:MAG: phage portal protein [Propioniciclava sp.]|uniref:phage portal protein n=1 Tax=Propioniciclava sp. TaxID=2038686 RepID=UPI0039E4C95B
MRALQRLGLVRVTRSTMPAAIAPPTRQNASPITTRESVAVPAMYRALQVLATSASQLALDVKRGGVLVHQVPSIITKPDTEMSREDWIELAVMSLAATGKLFVYAPTAPDGTRLELTILPPHEVYLVQERDQRGIVRLRGFDYAGVRYTAEEVLYAPLLRLPGDHNGLGPIQAAQAGLTSVKHMRAYMEQWFDNAGQPSGLLTSDQPLTSADARTARNRWNGLDDSGNPIDGDTPNPSRIKVLGKGMHYDPIFLSPKDALWLDAQGYNRLEVAQLMGIPGSLMLVAPEGGSRSYQNVEQEWIGFTRYTLTWYLSKLEALLTRVLVRGQAARFRIETLLRSDTKTRYEAHDMALSGGWMTPAEVRDIEGLAPHADIPDAPRPISAPHLDQEQPA